VKNMEIYECVGCGDYYYKMTKQCPYCDCTTLTKLEGTEEEVLIIVLREINIESGVYEQFDYESLKEKVSKKLGNNDYGWMSFDNALKKACDKGYFSEITLYISSA